MDNKLISTDLAWRMRFERGLRLPANAEYKDPRVKKIAAELEQAYQTVEYWDDELKELMEDSEGMSGVQQYTNSVRDALKDVEKPCSVLLRIVWADSSMDSQWKDINDTKPELSICESVGWLACVSDDVVTIAPNKTVCDDAKDIQITAMMHIPIASIQKFAILKDE